MTLLLNAAVGYAQNGAVPVNALFQQPVGGVAINAAGLLDNAANDAQGKLNQIRAEVGQKIPAGLKKDVPLRSISLKRLCEAIRDAAQAGKPVSEEIAFLGGLQHIRYLFVYPDDKDIVLVGPAEGWKIDARGSAIGITSGQTVMLLDDLVVALRAGAQTGPESAAAGITCSIDPTPEGLQQLRTTVARMHTIGDPQQTSAAIEQALGRQQISVGGVPQTSHFARVLVAADYRMKRLAMKFDPAPIAGLPSFLDMLSGSGRGMSNMMQRWWLEPKFESLLKSPDGLAWEFKSAGVKCMTEDDFLGATGDRKQQGHANPLAQKWADNMTRHYSELALAEPVFGELRNCMELAIVGTLITRDNLADRAGCDLVPLTGDALLKAAELPRPTQVDSRVSMLKKGTNWVISASGGVMIRPVEFVENARKDDAPSAARTKTAAGKSAAWFWN
jgi:hypothetical protein